MDLRTLLTDISERIGDLTTAMLVGLLVGAVFGFAAQRSAFCLRSAAVEFSRGILGRSLAIWLLTFSTAMVWVQAAAMAGMFRPDTARIMAVTGSWSGAIIGGLLFGIGMVMARGCSGRLLVLAGTGNLRALTAGMVFALTAQLTLSGALSPVRQAIAAMWITPGGRNINLLNAAGLPQWAGLLIGLGFSVVAIGLAARARTGVRVLVWACGVGFAVALGWVLTFSLSQIAFEPVSVSSATFAGPSAQVVMALLTTGDDMSFDIGLIPGVFLGAFLGALAGRELKWESYHDAPQMLRSMAGGALMGFGGMLAGGCAIGAGLTGTSVFNATLWLAAVMFFVGAWIGDRIFDRKAAQAEAPVLVQR
ncbi:YeeE/YedE family protein [Paracoccus salsus]|uniref:YeeE/YedE family protein n=1 Tax=Paracoccus salsus TaxID=2911061 RepID=UPI001F1FD869|nr:YeeE/YedE family protein [Paracoccus salsus]MCF3973773.1 YeeE/YedE family protein [Paracoccus salsus]